MPKFTFSLWVYFNLPSKESVDQLLTQKVISMIFASIFGLIDLFVFKNLYDKYCNHSNITAYKTNIVIPTELKALNNIGDLPDWFSYWVFALIITFSIAIGEIAIYFFVAVALLQFWLWITTFSSLFTPRTALTCHPSGSVSGPLYLPLSKYASHIIN